MQIPINTHLSLDNQHWLLLKDGDAKALENLYRLYSNPLYNYGSKFTADKDQIKECIQELFVTLWTRRDRLGSPANIKNYLFKSFRLAIFKKAALIGKNQEYQETEHYPFSIALSIEDDLIRQEQGKAQQQRLETAIHQLTDRQREAIFLKFYENLSYDEIAEVMGISVKATYKIMARSLSFLRDNLSKDDLLLLISIFYLKLYN